MYTDFGLLAAGRRYSGLYGLAKFSQSSKGDRVNA